MFRCEWVLLTKAYFERKRARFAVVPSAGYIFGWNLGFVRIFSPYLKKNHGKGANARVRNPSRLVPHPRPIASYMDLPNSGTSAPINERTAVDAAVAEASYRGFASMKYVATHIINEFMPMPKKTVPSSGTIQ
jgi:hypothetical protein